MTPSEREEIERGVYQALENWDTGFTATTSVFDLIVRLCVSQVEKARAEQREKIAVYLEGTETWEGREFAKAIRNKLNQQGE